MALVLHHSTKTQLLARIRQRFEVAIQIEVWRLAAFLKSLLNAGEVTLLDIRTAFSLNPAQFNTLSAKLDGYTTRYYELKNAVGE